MVISNVSKQLKQFWRRHRIARRSPAKVLINCHHRNAENPLWHSQHQCLYWTDIPAGKLFRYRLGQRGYEQIYIGEPVGGFTIQADGSLLLVKTNGTVQIWQEGELTTVIDEILAVRGTRFNDAIADLAGRVFSGTIATDTAPGILYRIEPDGTYQAVVEDLKTPNGMAFTADYRYFYLTDSNRRTIYRFDYDQSSGSLSNQIVHIKTPDAQGVPDGMTMDLQGYLWSAFWGGGCLCRYSPSGEEVLKIELPTDDVSCVTFGGEHYDQLFISTAGGKGEGSSANGLLQSGLLQGFAGDIFSMAASVRGREEMRSRVGL
ncbi:MAG: SMP-30/gluconolactonase/LRE family protein [Cyanobacteria bacterium J06649_4]